MNLWESVYVSTLNLNRFLIKADCISAKDVDIFAYKDIV